MNISLIIPTKNQTEKLKLLLDSLKENTLGSQAVEIILVIDRDDEKSLAFTCEGLALKKIIVEPGLKMGELNQAGFKASSGKYVMLLNDDVLVKTYAWDEKVLAAFGMFPDQIALIHVNDRIFEDKLCTFPLLSRKFCEMASGICPADYERYRIDDHIYNIFNLLGILGERRIVYLPEVIFEHTNRHLIGAGNHNYLPVRGIHSSDTKLFDDLLPSRKRFAIRLKQGMELNPASEKITYWNAALEKVTDSTAIRMPEHVLWISIERSPDTNRRPVTIGIVTSDKHKDYARNCFDSVKKHTRNYNLIILDNNKDHYFNHPREMNWLISRCLTDFLVLMDDDVFVEPGWLEALLAEVDEETAVVAPLHKNGQGVLSFSGVYLMGDGYGTHAHLTDKPAFGRVCQCLCSAILLIDIKKCSNIFFNDSYSKYFLDLDYSLKIWESGYNVVCTPNTTVTHLSGATLSHGSGRSLYLLKKDLKIFLADWINSGRLEKIEENIWSNYPFLLMLSNIPKRINAIMGNTLDMELNKFKEEIINLLMSTEKFPLFRSFLFTSLDDYMLRCAAFKNEAKRKFCEEIIQKRLKNIPVMSNGIPPNLLESRDGYNIVEYKDKVYAVPQALGQLNMILSTQRSLGGILCANSQEELAPLISKLKGSVKIKEKYKSTQASPAPYSEIPVLIEEGFKGFNIILFEFKYYALPQEDGVFDVNRMLSRSYRFLIIGDTKETIKSKIKKASLAYNYFFKPARYIKRYINRTLKSGQSEQFNHRTAKNLIQHFLPEEAVSSRKAYAIQIEDNYDGFRMFYFDTRYFAILKENIYFDMNLFREGKYRPSFGAHTIEELKSEITRQVIVNKQSKPNNSNREKVLLLANASEKNIPNFLGHLSDYEVSMLVANGYDNEALGTRIIKYRDSFEKASSFFNIQNISPKLLNDLKQENYNTVVVPFDRSNFWSGVNLELLAAAISKRLMVISDSGKRRFYKGEEMRRISYNKAYLSSMLKFMPSLKDKKVLEVGCSDGLACDLLLNEDPKQIVGIDASEIAGCMYKDDRLKNFVMDAHKLIFDDYVFDLTYSIATLEHCRDPLAVLQEMKRVTKKGGYCYVQAGPLYYSPFGHHMFEYFTSQPWVHLLYSREEIIEYCEKNDIEAKIKSSYGKSARDYVNSMLNIGHVNGKRLSEYGIFEFMKLPDIEVINFTRSYEGEKLITKDIQRKLKGIAKDDLVSHGFELVFKVR